MRRLVLDRVKIVIADDHPLFCDALRNSIEGLDFDCEINVVGTLEDADQTVSESPDTDLLLLDLNMPGSSGFSGLMQLRANYPAVPVVVISATEDPITIRRSIELGASGFIPKSSSNEEIREATKQVLSGEQWLPEGFSDDSEDDPELAEISRRIQTLTPQQHKVLAMLGKGLLNKQIAYELSVSEATVKAHVSAVLLKLEVDSRTQAVIAMNKLGAGLGHGDAEEIRATA